MKKILYILPGIFLLSPLSAFAAASVSFSNPTFTGSSFTQYGDPYESYIFSPTGTNMFGNSVGSVRQFSTGASSFSKTTTDLSLTSLTDATYTIYFINADGFSATAETDCGGVKTLSQCDSQGDFPTTAIASTTFFIASTPASGSSTILLDTSRIDLSYILQAIMYGGILGIFLGIISKATKRLQIF